MVSVAIAPPARVAVSLSPASRRRVAIASMCVVASVAFFVDQIHLGHEIAAEEFRFRSHWTAPELAALAADRAARWKIDPPTSWRRLSREDQYMDEGLWHVRRRNHRWDEPGHAGSWQENRILEIYFAPVLDTASYVSPTGHRWPAEQRENAQRFAGPALSEPGRLQRPGESKGPYTSDAQPYPIVLVPRWAWRIGAVLLIVAIAMMRHTLQLRVRS